jgi:hypothetical protein
LLGKPRPMTPPGEGLQPPNATPAFGGEGDDAIRGGGGFGGRRGDRLHGNVGNGARGGHRGDFWLHSNQKAPQHRSAWPGLRRDRGGPGFDLIFANPGRDVSDGGDGRDVLWALARVDVTVIGDPDGDELAGGEGGDRFFVRDGEIDKVHCGGGNDRVRADQFDQVDNDCEQVDRRDITSLDQVEDQEENRTENPPEDNDEG